MGRMFLAGGMPVLALSTAAHSETIYRMTPPPTTITATPFQFAPVTIYRDSRGRATGTATTTSNGITIYRETRPWR